MKPGLVIFLHSHQYDRLYQASSMLLTASAMGWPCHLFLFYGALASFVNETWDEVNIEDGAADAPASVRPPWLKELAYGFETHNFPSLYDMINKAREEQGGLKVVACSTSCKVTNLPIDAVREKVDEVVGLPTMMQIAESAKHVLYL